MLHSIKSFYNGTDPMKFLIRLHNEVKIADLIKFLNKMKGHIISWFVIFSDL
jgi:hypothetical protein